MPEIDFFQATDVGCVREINEDAVGQWPHDDGGRTRLRPRGSR